MVCISVGNPGDDSAALDAAIEHAREIAFGVERASPCAREHEQLANWLVELKERREQSLRK